MRKEKLLLIVLAIAGMQNLIAQSISFEDDLQERGYFDRPYLRYEAEEGKCESDGSFLEPGYDQRYIQCEASGQSAVQLLAKNSYVQWTSEKAANGLTLRFSLPDTPGGTGTTGNLALYVDGDSVQSIILDSYWAWQYILRSGSKYPGNIPDSVTRFPRMPFDELHVKLNTLIPANAAVKLVKTDDNELAYTIDFIELEEIPAAVSFEDIQDENKVLYTEDLGNLQTFISQNGGKTIFIPEGRYQVDSRIYINSDYTRIIGAGMWYTEIFFSASSDDKSTYNKRGIETYNNNIHLEGLYLNTINNKRYYDADPVYQVGKGLMGSFGSNSLIKDLWVEHFECGGWIEGADNLSIQHCRFRNNYADGMNLAYGSSNSTVEHCSFRNNGDDDMASWSRADRLCVNNVYRYCTSENNWRASGLGFFGGKQNIAHNISVIDPVEAGFRVTSDFPGMPFNNEGYSEFYNISVHQGGVAAGTVGISGDLWGNQQGALNIFSSTRYDIQNIYIHDIDFYNSKNDAIFIGCSTYSIKNLILKDISINGTGRYGIFFYNPKGYGRFCNIQYQNIGAGVETNSFSSSFIFNEGCYELGLSNRKLNDIELRSDNGNLYISGDHSTMVSVYDVSGRKHYQALMNSEPIVVHNLDTGLYIVRWDQNRSTKVLVF